MELLERAKKGDPDAKEKMVLDNSGLIWSVVRRFFGRGLDSDDLYQLGCVGFLKAMDGFDLEFGTQFSTYAVPKIAGEIRRFLRDDGTVKVSRTIKEQAMRIKKARGILSAELGRDPYLSELSSYTGLSAEEIAAAETAVLPTDSLQRPTGDEGGSLEDFLFGEEMEEKIIENISLRRAISELEPRQKTVIDLRYYRGLTQEKTAQVIGISQVQVSRIERKAIEQLRIKLTEY